MTPFDTWYSTNVAPILEEQIKLLPEPTREPIRKGSREQMAACWNAAIDAVEEYCDEGLEHLPSLDKLRGRVTR